jgi:hypothetical protein
VSHNSKHRPIHFCGAFSSTILPAVTNTFSIEVMPPLQCVIPTPSGRRFALLLESEHDGTVDHDHAKCGYREQLCLPMTKSMITRTFGYSDWLFDEDAQRK